jgi:hypothetical protein
MVLVYKGNFLGGSAFQILILTVLISNSGADFDISLDMKLRCRLWDFCVLSKDLDSHPAFSIPFNASPSYILHVFLPIFRWNVLPHITVIYLTQIRPQCIRVEFFTIITKTHFWLLFYPKEAMRISPFSFRATITYMSVFIASAVWLLGAMHDVDTHLFWSCNERMTLCRFVTLLITLLILGIIRLQNQMQYFCRT